MNPNDARRECKAGEPEWHDDALLVRCARCPSHPGAAYVDGSGTCAGCGGSAWIVLATRGDAEVVEVSVYKPPLSSATTVSRSQRAQDVTVIEPEPEPEPRDEGPVERPAGGGKWWPTSDDTIYDDCRDGCDARPGGGAFHVLHCPHVPEQYRIRL